MIRGVNKNIIEISDTGNDCFERAILFVRPDKIERDGDHIKRRAADYLAGIKLRPWFYPRGKLMLTICKLLGAATVGAVITAVILTI